MQRVQFFGIVTFFTSEIALSYTQSLPKIFKTSLPAPFSISLVQIDMPFVLSSMQIGLYVQTTDTNSTENKRCGLVWLDSNGIPQLYSNIVSRYVAKQNLVLSNVN